nr:MAG TPA: Glutaredoxin arsenate reductase [Caudoviricetes sp.]
MQNRAFLGKTRRNKIMIKVLFICHGSRQTYLKKP